MTKMTFDGLLSYGRAALRIGAFLSPLLIVAAQAAYSLSKKMDHMTDQQTAMAVSVAKLMHDVEQRPTTTLVGEKIDAKIDAALLRLRIMESLAELRQQGAATQEALKEIQHALRK